MNIILFTKPKDVTFQCLKYLVANASDSRVSVVLNNRDLYLHTPFYQYCLNHHIDIYDGEDVYKSDVIENCDLLISNTYPKKIRSELISATKKYAINFHSAPLPQYRGTFGYNFAIFNGEKDYGVTAHFLSDKFDRGDIIEVKRFPVDCEKISLEELIELSNEHLLSLFISIIDKILRDEELERHVQNEREARYYSRSDFEELKKISFNDSTEVIDRKIRACWYPPYEGAYIELGGKRYALMVTE